MGSNAIVLPSNLPVGFRFSPTEEEVIDHYLRRKLLGMDSEVDRVIAEVDFCKWDPWELPLKSKIKSDDQVWWFFAMRDYKYSNRKRSNRKTKTGFWTITGTEKKIKGRARKGFIGAKRVLVFHENSNPKKGTSWVMHEYYTETDNALSTQSAYVVCRLELKRDENGQQTGTPDYEKGETSGEIMPDLENPVVSAAIPVGHGHFEVNLESVSQPLYSPDFHLIDEVQALFGADESEEDDTIFANSLIVDPEENYCGATTDNLLKRSYFQEGPFTSDTDNEGINEQYIQLQALESSSSLELPGGTKKFRPMRMVHNPTEPLRTSTGDNSVKRTIAPPPMACTPIAPPCNQFSDEDASSDDLTARRGEIKLCTATAESGRVSVSGGGRQRRIQLQRKDSSVAISGDKAREAPKHSTASVDQPLKEKSTSESPSAREKAQTSNLENNLKSARCESTVSNWKSCFTFVEASSVLSSDSTPPSVYVCNSVVGAVLFVVFVRELLLFGSWS